jgi:hypothetical protein
VDDISELIMEAMILVFGLKKILSMFEASVSGSIILAGVLLKLGGGWFITSLPYFN